MKRLSVIFSALFLAAGMSAALAAPPALAATCTATLGQNCGPYSYSGIPMSNGSDTYAGPQNVGSNSGTTATATVTDPGNWNAVENATPYGYGGVQTFTNVQQLTNDWNGSGWGGSGSSDTPLSALSALSINYSESMGTVDSNTSAEFAPDIWTEEYPSDVMFWADTEGRCNNGAYGGTILGTASIDGQTWTVNRYGGAGAEIIFVLDSDPATPDSCANQTSGSIDIKAGFDWLISHGYLSSATFTQVNTGWEITSAANETFTMSSYSMTATAGGGGGGQQAPAVTTGAASGVSQTGATLNGSVNPEGADASYQFDYGTSAAYGSSVPVPAGDAGSGTTAVPETASLTGLTAGTAYHYRLEATNATGTTFGADQQFTASAAGGTVAFGAAAPGSGGAKCANCATLGWNAAVSGTNPALLAEVAVGTPFGGDGSCVVAGTDNGTAMALLATVHDNGQSAGFHQVWGVTAPSAGMNAVAFSVSGCGTPEELTGGSLTFTGASQSAPFGTPVAAHGSGTAARVTTSGSTGGDMVAGFASNGSAINSAASPAASRYRANEDIMSGAGNSAGATAPATGSNVVMKWNVTNDWWGVTAVQVLHA